MGEFYGATEGNIVFFNFWSPGEPTGAIGEQSLLRGEGVGCVWMGWCFGGCIGIDGVLSDEPRPTNHHHTHTGKGGFFNRLIMGWTIVKFDPIKEEPVKDKYGRLIPCKGTCARASPPSPPL